MASFSLYLLQEWLQPLFARRPAAPECTADVVLAARHEAYLHRRFLEMRETCDAGLHQQDAKQGEMVVEHDGKTSSDGPPRRPRHSHEGTSEMTMGLSSPAMPSRRPRFILDSRAARHAAGNISLFSPSSFTSAIPATSWPAATTTSLPDGSHLPIIGVGTISCDKFHLTDVLYVPGMRAGLNLVSVQQLAERDYLVMFGGGQCSVKERSSGKIVGKGRMNDDDGLYHLDFLTIP